MAYKDDFSLEKMFIEHKVQIMRDGQLVLEIKIPTIADHFKMPDFNRFLDIFNNKKQDFIKVFKLINKDVHTEYEIFREILINSHFEELKLPAQIMYNVLGFICQDIIQLAPEKIILSQHSLTLDEELFDYILYIFRKSEGIKIEPPRTFKSESDRQKYLQQIEREERIRRIKTNGIKMDKNGKELHRSLVQIMNIIIYSYPQYKIEDLFNMSFIQIQFLQENAQKILKYKVESAAYASGNLKKLKNFWD